MGGGGVLDLPGRGGADRVGGVGRKGGGKYLWCQNTRELKYKALQRSCFVQYMYMYVWPSCVVTTVVSAVGEHIPTYTGS